VADFALDRSAAGPAKKNPGTAPKVQSQDAGALGVGNPAQPTQPSCPKGKADSVFLSVQDRQGPPHHAPLMRTSFSVHKQFEKTGTTSDSAQTQDMVIMHQSNPPVDDLNDKEERR